MQPPAQPEGAEEISQDTKPISPASTTGVTQAVKTAEESKSKETPDIDADGIRSAFETPMPSSEEEEEQEPSDDDEIAKAEADTQFATGLGGAIQAFGEGLAAITGGSAKGLQTGVRAYQEVAARKEASLRDRIRMKRQKESDEYKYRDQIEDRQKKQRLKDPASEESAAARQEAGLLMDALISRQTAQGASQGEIEKLNEIKAVMLSENMTAEQIVNFQSKLKEMDLTKPKQSVESKQTWEREKQMTAEDRQQKSFATRQYFKDATEMKNQVAASNKILDQLIQFKQNLEKAKNKNNTEAIAYVRQFTNTVNYILAREKEPKGVFTDNDLKALSVFDSGMSFEEQAVKFTSEKLTTNEIDDEVLKRIERGLNNALPQLQNANKQLIQRQQAIYRKSDNPYLVKKADDLPEIFDITDKSQSAQPQTAQPQSTKQSFTSHDEVVNALKDGRLKPGEVFYFNGVPQTAPKAR